MNKRVGAVEVLSYESSDWVEVTYHCNDSVKQSIDLRSYDDLVDALYALGRVKAAIDERRAERRSGEA